MKQLFQRFSIYGDFWLRYLHWGSRHCPWFLEPMFIFAFAGMFWLMLGRTRCAIARNLAVLLPGSSRTVNQLRVFRVFWNFAWSMADMAKVRAGQKCIRWEVCGTEHLEELEREPSGAILLTAHMGNYDVAAPLFAQRIHRQIHLVRAPEREQKSQEFESAKRGSEVGSHFVIHYNEPGNMLGVTLAQVLATGGIVAVQGDRVLFDVSPVEAPFDERVRWKVPRGPFTLALVGRVPIHPVFIIRMGWRRYRIQAEPVMQLDMQSRDREGVVSAAATRWSGIVRRIARRYWRQWFVFEDLFESVPAASAGAAAPAESGGADPPVDLVIPAGRNRGVAATFFWNLVAGGWTSAVVLRRLLEWGVGDGMKVAMAVLAWPLVWFVAMVAIVQLALGMGLLLQRILRLPGRACDVLSGAILLAVFGATAWSEFRGGCPVGCWLGILGFTAIGAGLVHEAIYQTARE